MEQKKTPKPNFKGTQCKNCATLLNGSENFCPSCSQINDIRPLSIKKFANEFFANFFSFDTKFFHSIVPLLLKPGKVSREFIEGKRKKYTNPFQLYIHVSILFFIIIGLISSIQKYSINKTEFQENVENNAVDSLSSINLLTQDIIENTEKYEELIEWRIDSIIAADTKYNIINTSAGTKPQRDSLYTDLVKKSLTIVEIVKEINDENWRKTPKLIESSLHYKLHAEMYVNDQYGITYNKRDYTVNFPDTIWGHSTKKYNDFITYATKHEKSSIKSSLKNLNYPITNSNLYWFGKAKEFHKLNNNDELFILYIKSVISKISLALFFLLPIVALFFKLLYIRKKYSYTDHLVVIFYLQSVFFIFILIGNVLDSMLTTRLFSIIAVFLFVFYFYKTLRNFYQQGRFKTFLKFIMANIFYFIVIFFGSIVTIVLSFLLG